MADEADAIDEWLAALRLQVEAAAAAGQWARARSVLEVLLGHAQQTDLGQVAAVCTQLNVVCRKAGDPEAAERYRLEAWDLELRGNLGRGAGF